MDGEVIMAITTEECMVVFTTIITTVVITIGTILIMVTEEDIHIGEVLRFRTVKPEIKIITRQPAESIFTVDQPDRLFPVVQPV